MFHNFKEKYSTLRQRHIDQLVALGATPEGLEALEEKWMDAIVYLKGFAIVVKFIYLT